MRLWLRSRCNTAAFVVALAIGITPDSVVAQNPASARPAALAGVVTDTLGRPLSGARVTVAGALQEAVADDSGRFHLPEVTPGRREFTVRHIGYTFVSFEATLPPDTTIVLLVRLSPIAALDEVLVISERPSHFTRTGFLDRQRSGVGHFLSPERIAQMSHISTPSQLLRDVPGVNVRCRPGQEPRCLVIPRRDPSCMWLWVDGVPHATKQVDEVVDVGMIYAIEVYDRPAKVPARFQGVLPPKSGLLTVSGGCGALVVWTTARAR